MPEMQEQFPAIAMDGVYAGNARAIPGSPDGGKRQLASAQQQILPTVRPAHR